MGITLQAAATPNKENTLVIYHGNCVDGFASAAIAHSKLGNVSFLPGFYNHRPPKNLEGRKVYLCDFSWGRPQLEAMLKLTPDITVLDHHKTAQAALQPLLDEGALKGVFDMNESGATLTYKHFYPEQEIPEGMAYVRDRDIFKLEMPNSSGISRVLGSYSFKPKASNLASWFKRLTTPEEMAKVKEDCEPIWRFVGSVTELYCQYARYVKFKVGGKRTYYTALVACPNFFSTEVAVELLKRNPDLELVLMWQQVADTVQFSVRGAPGLDVSEIAKIYGGGGHAGASGFSLEQLDKRVMKLLMGINSFQVSK